jgi:hypothetical protein
MVKLTDDGVFPANRAKVWKLIEAHQTDFQTIHPDVKSTKLLRKEGNSNVVEQQYDMNGQPTKMVLKITPSPPEKLTLEILEGPMTGKMVNTYSDVSGGTKVVTECDMKSQLMDDKQLHGTVKQFLDNAFNDDVRYLTSKMK